MFKSMLTCPRCKTNLDQTIFHRTEVDYCPTCLGIFFEENELRYAKDARDENLAWLDIDLWKDETKFKLNHGIRLCPACRLPMYEVYYGDSNIIVDVCNVCYGIWLDRGEFKKIIDYLKARADWQILHNYGKALLEEFLEIFTGPETIREELFDFLIVLKLLKYKLLTQHPKIAQIIFQISK
jgi:Zn-finger nucleic acid-binding protein